MTVYDIARIAKVSPATVSLALNDRPGVSAATKEKILAIAEEQGYPVSPKAAASSPKLMKLIAVSKPNASDIHNFRTSFFAEIINWTQKRCSKLGYSMLYQTFSHDNFIEEIKMSETAQPSSGIILIGTYLEDEEVDMLTHLPYPMVVLDRECPLTCIDSVRINNRMGAYLAIDELISLGHRKIGYIRSSSSVFNLQERHHGFLYALEKHGLKCSPDHYFRCNSYVPDGVSILRENLKGKKSLPTAFFCENDYTAISLISALNSLGIKVPDDVSVTGFDDVPECNITSPQLTTIYVDKKMLAYTAVNRLHEKITLKFDITLGISVDVRLIRRTSTNHPNQR